MDNNEFENLQEIRYVNEYRKLRDVFSFKKLGERSYIDKFILQTFVCLVLVTLLLLITSVNTMFTNTLSDGVRAAVSWNVDFSDTIDTFSDIKNIIPNARKTLGLTEVTETESFIMPVDGIITSNFGIRIHPVFNTEKMHSGIDISSEIGTPIKASIGGKVTEVGEDELNGKYIRIVNGKYETVYAHCHIVIAQEGKTVNQGDIIAEVGDTGITSGPHLHFEILEDGIALDPLEKIDEEMMQ